MPLKDGSPRRSRIAAAFAMAALVAMGTVAGCAGSSANDRLEKRITEAASVARAVRLSDATDLSWDQVVIFRDFWRGSDMNAFSGVHVMDEGDYQDEGFVTWVFLSGGQLAATMTTGYSVLLADAPSESKWSNDVWLVPNPIRPGTLILGSLPGSSPTPTSSSNAST